MRLNGTIIAAALLLSACGGGDSSETVENSQMTVMNSAGTIEGTTNDAAAMDDPMNSAIATDPVENSVSDNATSDEGAGEPVNKM